MNSIRKRVLAALLLAGLLPLAIIIFVTQSLTTRALQESQHDKVAEIGKEVARQVATHMENAALDLESLRSNPFLVDPGATPDERLSEMQRLVGVYDLFTDITLYNESGEIVNSTSFVQPELIERSVWFTRALDGKVSISAPQPLLGQPGLHLTVYLPVLSSGTNTKHIIKGRIPFNQIWTLLDGVNIGKAGSVVLIDDHGNLLAHRNKHLIYEKFDERYPADFWRRFPYGTYYAPNGAAFTYAAETIDEIATKVESPWTLISMQPTAEMNAVVDEALSYQLLAGLIIVLVASAMGVVLSRKLASPVIVAARAAQKVAAGDLDTEIPETGPMEMREMSSSFNKMVREVKHFRERLESLVDSRTESLRESQENLEDLTSQLRAAYEATQEAILVVKPDGEIIAANRHIRDFFGLDERDASHMRFNEFKSAVDGCFPAGDEPNDRWKLYERHDRRAAEEVWTIASPRSRTLSVYTAPVNNHNGEAFARLWMFRDITEKRELEQSLQQAQKMEAIGRLAGGVAHDFNNLLTGIIGNLSLAEMECAASDDENNIATSRFIGSAKKAGQRAAELVKQLLGFSRRSHLQLGPCNVDEIISDMHELLTHSLDPRIQIVCDTTGDLWTIKADATQIEQVLMNMCVNAKDAMPEHGGSIAITSRNIDITPEEAERVTDAAPGPHVCVSVSDNGSGMNKDVLGKIFEPFFTTKEQGKGTGLGLATSYGIIRQHGGWITCESTPGEGTSFHVHLPKAAAAAPGATNGKSQTGSGKITGGSETILLVDDEPVVLAVAEGVLKQFGYKTRSATNGQECLDIALDAPDSIDVILLDLTMPTLSGRDTFRQLREHQPQLPVIICSGYMVDPDQFKKETGSRPDGFVQKPYKVEELAHTLRNVLDKTKQPNTRKPRPARNGGTPAKKTRRPATA